MLIVEDFVSLDNNDDAYADGNFYELDTLSLQSIQITILVYIYIYTNEFLGHYIPSI